jgi:hypothetical protein
VWRTGTFGSTTATRNTDWRQLPGAPLRIQESGALVSVKHVKVKFFASCHRVWLNLCPVARSSTIPEYLLNL